MAIYLGLGSNEGSRKANLEKAIVSLKAAGFEIHEISPVVESPAMLPDDAESCWNKPYLNCVIKGQVDWQPMQALSILKTIEKELGRQPSRRWAPRPIDIDILIWNELCQRTDQLTIPHPGLASRAFVLSPLCAISPGLVIPGTNKTVFELSQNVSVIPLWMGILNLTPDSFSDGNTWGDSRVLAEYLDEMISNHVQIIDLGAESTRPGAETISPKLEWQRLQPALELIQERLAGMQIRPLISLDSRNHETMQRALGYGVNIINDVSGLSSPAVIDLVKNSGCQVISMHSTVVPADPSKLLPTDQPAITQVKDWLNRNLEWWIGQGIKPDQVIFDPGVGFGKNVLQTLDLLGNVKTLREFGFRLLIGHSRKSFMRGFADNSPEDRDLGTLGMSLSLCHQGVDIIRVHNPVMHAKTYRAWSHISN
ncbi:MAG: dihydropteroate synthase [Gammaproteobacteria bacterium]|nr:dihydropteroate synthase [Gammaproteobacteria bacterium]